MMHPKLQALFEVLKDFIRWALSYFFAWLIPNGYAFVMSFFTAHNITPDPQIIFFLGLFFKYLDFYWHRYQKNQHPELSGQSLGIFKV